MDNMMLSKLDYVYKLLFIITLVVFTLILTGDLVIPILIGGFIAFALIPVNQWLELKKIPGILDISLSLIAFISIIGLFAYLISIQLTGLVKNLPNLQEKFKLLLENIHHFIEDNFGLNIKEQESIFQKGVNNASSFISTILLSHSE